MKYFLSIFLFFFLIESGQINGQIPGIEQTLGPDKIAHNLISQSINTTVFSNCYYYMQTKRPAINPTTFNKNNIKALLISNGITLFAGGFKEIVIDGFFKLGVASIMDFWADVIGAWTSTIFITAVFTIPNKH